MSLRAAEDVLRASRFGTDLRLRVDLHGVSVLGPGEERTLIRWEWIEDIHLDDGVEVRSATSQVRFPPGAFRVAPEVLVALLEQARSIEHRPGVIDQLGRSQPPRR